MIKLIYFYRGDHLCRADCVVDAEGFIVQATLYEVEEGSEGTWLMTIETWKAEA